MSQEGVHATQIGLTFLVLAFKMDFLKSTSTTDVEARKREREREDKVLTPSCLPKKSIRDIEIERFGQLQLFA